MEKKIMKHKAMDRKELKKEELKRENNQGRTGFWTAKDPGIDGILVTVGLCIIALLLCVVMRDSLTEFIQTIVGDMTSKAQGILGGTGAVPGM